MRQVMVLAKCLLRLAFVSMAIQVRVSKVDIATDLPHGLGHIGLRGVQVEVIGLRSAVFIAVVMLPTADLRRVHIDFPNSGPGLELLPEPLERGHDRHDGDPALATQVERNVLSPADVGLPACRAVVSVGRQRPKIIPIHQKPLITYAFDHLLHSGFTEFIVNTHHRAEAYSDTFPDGNYRGAPITFRHEPDLLETGGGIANISDLVAGDSFMVYNGDILTDLPLEPAIEGKRARFVAEVPFAAMKVR